MNMINRDSFTATRQPSGDVWIQAKQRQYRRDYQPLPPEDSERVIIPEGYCTELAKFLMGPEPCYKTDFSRCVDEPE